MKPSYNAPLISLFAVSVLLFLASYSLPSIEQFATHYTASVFFKNSIETKDIVAKFDATDTNNVQKPDIKKVKILIVPGHDNINSGAQFGSVPEANLNLQLGLELNRLLSTEEGVEVSMTRDSAGYNPVFKSYLEKEETAIVAFREEKKRIMNELISQGKVMSYINIHHNTARPEVVSILYGVNKFASDNGYDIVLHIHFNDYPGRKGVNGKYSGFSIYVPEQQYSNADASYDFAERLRDQLLQVSAESDLPNEDAITEDQELIAVGSFNTLDPAVALIEYGYIYESQFTDSNVGDTILKELASQTYLGIMQYIKGEQVTKKRTFELFNNFAWTRDMVRGDIGIDVLALQDTLHDLGYYPRESTLNVCPLSGKFGSCTEKALIAYQKSKGIQPTGIFGEITKKSFEDGVVLHDE